jgi:hypothetical protein
MPRNPEKPRGGVHQHTAGVSHREAMKGSRRSHGISTAESAEPPAGYGFSDVRRACHAWLMKHDQRYRETRRSSSPMPHLRFGSAE